MTTWFAHTCWFCGHRSKHVVFIVGDSNYQCLDQKMCQERHDLRALAGIIDAPPTEGAA